MLGASRVSPRTGSLRSPLPLLAAGILVALLLILLVAQPPRQPSFDPSTVEALSPSEVLTLVAREMRSDEAALQVVREGQARFDDGTWYVTVGDAQFHFSQRNRVVVADNEAAQVLQFRSRSP